MAARSVLGDSPLSAQFLHTVAHLPGVYLMKDGGGQVLYVGKARDLRKRLSSYARPPQTLAAKTAMLLGKVRQIETIITQTEKEALILEASLIKKHRPRYNVLLRDDKSYPLIKVTVREQWPRVMVVRRRSSDGARYFGPFSSSSAMWDTLRLLNSVFPLRRCKGEEVLARSRPCLNFQMRRCVGPCVGEADPEQYARMVDNVLMILDGKKDELLRELTGRMEAAAVALRFEEAAQYRDWLQAVRKTLEKQMVVATHRLDQDVFALVRRENAVAISVLLVRQGRLEDHQAFFVADPLDDDPEILRQALARFYGSGRAVPLEVVLPLALPDTEVMGDWLADLRGGKVNLVVPQRGDRTRLLQMAAANAEQVFADRKKRAQSWQALAAAIQQALTLRQLPQRIECLDISNIGGERAVGSLVCFEQGEAKKSGYRHYKIRTVTGADDYAMMGEVLRRRLAKGREQGDLPDLLLVDGGKGQVNVARTVLAEFDLSAVVDLVGIAKERQEEGEKLFLPGRKNAVLLARHSPVLLFLMRVRDEAHRYGVTFHRRWRQKDTLRSSLDQVPGVGAARRKALLSSLGSVKRIAAATFDELAAVPGIGPELGQRIWNFFNAPGPEA